MNWRRVNAVVTAVAMVALAGGAGPTTTTRPAGVVVEMAEPVDVPSGSGGLYTSNLRVKLASGAGVPTAQEWKAVLGRAYWPCPGRPDILQRPVFNAFEVLGGDGRLEFTTMVPGNLMSEALNAMLKMPGDHHAGEGAEAAARVVAEWLHGVVTSDNSTSPADRTRRLEEVRTELGRVRAMMDALRAMAESQPQPAGALAERIKALRAERERLQMIQAAKEARQEALGMGIDRQREKAAQGRQDDAILQQLQQVLKLREEEVRKLQELQTAGVAGTSELSEARAKAAEAQVKLAERENALGKAGKGEILDRLADEMTMAGVDLVDVRLQLDRVEQDLSLLNPATATTQSLERAVKDGTVPAGAGVLPPLYGELQRREWELAREKVVLQVEDVEVTTEKESK